jgi:uncharacterized protein (DUF697 family)
MSLNLFKTVKDAIAHLNPNDIRAEADRPLRVGLFANSETAYRQMEAYFCPAMLSPSRRQQVCQVIERAAFEPGKLRTAHDIEIYSSEFPSQGGFSFNVQNPEITVQAVLRAHPDRAISLARHLEPFRKPVVCDAIKKISRENALFSLATAIPDVVPFISLPWAIGEFASDTAVLTANQIRMAFLLAAANDREVGYREQRGEIATILLGAFGWRAIAREVVGKIPFGGGLIAKAGVAYAGTRVVGLSLERYYRVGYHLTKAERTVEFQKALEKGKTIAGSVLNVLKRHQPAPSQIR